MTETLIEVPSEDELLETYSDGMTDARINSLGRIVTAFEALARPLSSIDAVKYTGQYTTGPDNHGRTHPDYRDVDPD